MVNDMPRLSKHNEATKASIDVTDITDFAEIDMEDGTDLTEDFESDNTEELHERVNELQKMVMSSVKSKDNTLREVLIRFEELESKISNLESELAKVKDGIR